MSWNAAGATRAPTGYDESQLKAKNPCPAMAFQGSAAKATQPTASQRRSPGETGPARTSRCFTLRRLLRGLLDFVLPAREQPLAAFLRAVLVEIDLGELHLGRLRRHRMDLGVLVRRDLKLADGQRDVLPGRRQDEV